MTTSEKIDLSGISLKPIVKISENKSEYRQCVLCANEFALPKIGKKVSSKKRICFDCHDRTSQYCPGKTKTGGKNSKSVYAKAGVNIDAAEKAVTLMKKHIRSTYTDETLSDIGSFAGLFDLFTLENFSDEPVLVQSIDGVGTKVMVAEMMGNYSIGQCIVNHCVNDILVLGAAPLTFLNYIGAAELSPEVIAKIVEQMAIACKKVGIPLIGGETAEMPGVYHLGRHDVVGCITGVAEKDKIINGSKI